MDCAEVRSDYGWVEWGLHQVPRFADRGKTMGTLMAEEKREEKKVVKSGFTTFRIYEQDGEDFSDFAALEGKTAADTYREHVAPLIKKLLRARMEARLKKLG
jgi:hypothetical protein